MNLCCAQSQNNLEKTNSSEIERTSIYKLLFLSCNCPNMFVTNVDYNVCFIYRDLFGDELKSSDEPQTTESMETRYDMSRYM